MIAGVVDSVRRGKLPRQAAEQIASDVCARRHWDCDETLSTSRGWRTWFIRPNADGVATGPWIQIDARTEQVRRFDTRSPGERRTRYIAGGLIVAALVALASAYFGIRVCDQKQAAGGSRVVSVCRHLDATDPPVIALGIVVLVCLGMFYSEISGFGVSLKRQVQEAAEVAKSAQQLGIQNQKVVKDVRETTDDLTDYNRRKAAKIAEQPAIVDDHGAGLDAELRRLADRYNTLRGTMSSGPERTSRMTEVVKDARTALRHVDGFDFAGSMSSADRGERLVAYAYLKDHVAAEHLTRIVDAAISEDKPFGQYWALLAVENQLGSSSVTLTDQDRRKLEVMQGQIGPATDRGTIIRRILSG